MFPRIALEYIDKGQDLVISIKDSVLDNEAVGLESSNRVRDQFSSRGSLSSPDQVAAPANGSNDDVNVLSMLGLQQPKIDPPELERLIHELTNEQREKHGLSPLAYDARLARIAKSHSLVMAQLDFSSNVNLVGQDHSARGREAGYRCRKEYRTYYTEGISEYIFQT